MFLILSRQWLKSPKNVSQVISCFANTPSFSGSACCSIFFLRSHLSPDYFHYNSSSFPTSTSHYSIFLRSTFIHGTWILPFPRKLGIDFDLVAFAVVSRSNKQSSLYGDRDIFRSYAHLFLLKLLFEMKPSKTKGLQRSLTVSNGTRTVTYAMQSMHS